MAQYSPKLIAQTISVFESRTGRVISHEDARQAVENISGFFQVLQEWAEAEESLAESPSQPAPCDGGAV